MNITVSGSTLLAAIVGLIVFVIGLIVVLRFLFAKRSSQKDLSKKETSNSLLIGRNKLPQVDVFRLSGTFFNVALAFSLSVVILAFSWTKYDSKIENTTMVLFKNAMLKYNLSDINEILQGTFLQQKKSADIKYLSIDSRNLSFPKETLFFALKGPRRSGHSFIKDAYKAGVRNFVVSKKVNTAEFKQATFILVNDSLEALQTLASHHRSTFHIPIVGITGSNGKTIVKEWLYTLLKDDVNIVKSPKSYNSQIGVPLSVWQINETHEMGLFEAGISEVGEMQKLHNIIQPDIVIFTNIGPAHQAGFRSTNQKIKEKLKLFGDSGMLIYCIDHDEIHDVLFKSKQTIRTLNWTCKKNAKADIRFELKKLQQHTEVKATYTKRSFRFNLPFVDESSIENALHCCCVLLCDSNYHNDELLNKKLAMLNSMPMRLELKAGINNCILVDDTYNTDYDSLKIALDFQDQQNKHLQNALILTDVFQSGKSEAKLYQEIADLVNSKKIERFIGIGPKIKKHQAKFKIKNKTFFSKTSSLTNKIGKLEFNNECILFKGARKFELETVVNSLSQKLHRTSLEINLNALTDNLNVYKKKLKEETKIMAMVKAFSYGAGTFEIANTLQYNKVDYLSVAYTDEGVALRKAGIETPIMVLNPDGNTYQLLLQRKLEPEVYSLSQIEMLSNFLIKNKTKQKLKIHLNIDTGMNRLGFDINEIPTLVNRLKEDNKFHVASIFSHLTSSEDLEEKEFTKEQVSLFKTAAENIEKGLNIRTIKHILNSNGIANYTKHQLDMVRLGIGLYGIDGSGKLQNKLTPVSQLKTYIAQIKQVKKGETVGYSRAGKAKKNLKIATVCIGYGDGLPRLAGNSKFSMQIMGQAAPIIGNICMDMCMLDVSHLENVKEGDEVVVFGSSKSLNALSKAAQTIPYEILTNIAERVKRIYYKD